MKIQRTKIRICGAFSSNKGAIIFQNYKSNLSFLFATVTWLSLSSITSSHRLCQARALLHLHVENWDRVLQFRSSIDVFLSVSLSHCRYSLIDGPRSLVQEVLNSVKLDPSGLKRCTRRLPKFSKGGPNFFQKSLSQQKILGVRQVMLVTIPISLLSCQLTIRLSP